VYNETGRADETVLEGEKPNYFDRGAAKTSTSRPADRAASAEHETSPSEGAGRAVEGVSTCRKTYPMCPRNILTKGRRPDSKSRRMGSRAVSFQEKGSETRGRLRARLPEGGNKRRMPAPQENSRETRAPGKGKQKRASTDFTLLRIFRRGSERGGPERVTPPTEHPSQEESKKSGARFQA